jgi:beta propeller repeat protein
VSWVRQVDGTGTVLVRDVPNGPVGAPERVLATGRDLVPWVHASPHHVVISEYTPETRLSVFDLDFGTELHVHRDDLNSREWFPSVTDQLLFYTLHVNGDDGTGWPENSDVYALDLASHDVTSVAPNPAIQTTLGAVGRRLLWWDDRYGHHTWELDHIGELFYTDLDGDGQPHDLTNRGNQDLTTGPVFGFDGHKVLAVELRNGFLHMAPPTCQLVEYDVDAGSRSEHTPQLSGSDCDLLRGPAARMDDWLVYEADPDDQSDLWLWNLRTHERRQLTAHPLRSTAPVVEGRIVVWQDNRNGGWDLYMMDLTDLEAGDLSPEGVTP